MLLDIIGAKYLTFSVKKFYDCQEVCESRITDKHGHLSSHVAKTAVERAQLARHEHVVPVTALKLTFFSIFIVGHDVCAAREAYLDSYVPSSHSVIRAKSRTSHLKLGVLL